LVGDREPFGIVLPIGFADEEVNPEKVVIFQRTPYLFRYSFKKKEVIKGRLRGYQVECFLG
jgi:hypothetical protein